MTGRNMGAALAKVEEEHIKSQVDIEMLCFHYMILVVAIGFSMSGLASSRYSSPAFDVVLTVLSFTLVTIEMQIILAISMASKPAPCRIPSPLNEWMVAIAVWLFLVTYFLFYASASLHALEPGYWDLIVAGIASAVNLAITVYTMLHHRV